MPNTSTSEEIAFQEYLKAGEARAMALENRGPVRFTDTGELHPEIVEAFWRVGFYVFENVLRPEEIEDLKSDVRLIQSRLPTTKGGKLDSNGKLALGADQNGRNFYWSKPLADPFGGTDLAGGRHPVKMREPKPRAGTPEEIVYLILGSLQYSDACLRVYGHPDLLRIAAAINGEDFTPFNEALFIKAPGLGASVAWHRDGLTHYDSPNWDEGVHGFNFMGQVFGCTAANGVWVVPGSHKLRRVDIPAMAAAAQSDQFPDAVPIICAAGDVAMTNRQAIHGSFANTSEQWRVTVNMGFHRRSSVLNVEAGGLHNARAVYDDERIKRRARMLGYAIDARQQRFPDETPYEYKPHRDSGLVYHWNEKARADIWDYNKEDLSI
jgi:hypothetical protein